MIVQKTITTQGAGRKGAHSAPRRCPVAETRGAAANMRTEGVPTTAG